MRTALERRAALLVLGAGGGLTGAAVLFSAGSSSSRLLWLGLAALVLSGAAGTAAAAGWWPLLGREALVAFALLVAFVCWCGLSILWSIEPDRSWDYLNRGLVYVAFAVAGLAVGSFVPRAARLWAWTLAGVIALAVAAKPQAWFHDFTRVPTNPAQTVGSGRLTSFNSNSRWQWWTEAWRAFEKQPLRGTGAGTFEVSHRLFRSNPVVVTEPHNVPLQFLSETGVVGFLLAVGSVAAAAVAVVRRVRGSPAGLAVAVGALAYVLHSVVDFDWDFVAVTGPFLLSVGVLLGGRVVRRPWQWTLAPVPAALALAVAYSLLAPWFATRAADAALGDLEAGRPAQAVGHARDARSLNPFALEPLFLEAGAAEQLGDLSAARSLYVKAIELQPLNWWPWYELGSFELDLLNYPAAVPPLRRAVELDPHGTLACPLLLQAEAKVHVASPLSQICVQNGASAR